MKDLKPIRPLERHNYVAFFLSLACNLRCPYCINQHDRRTANSKKKLGAMSADDWIKAANRLVLREDLALTLQGGEPTIHKDFYRFVNGVKKDIKMDLLTNMMFDVDRFIKEVPVWRFTRQAPYAAIRASFHPDQNDIDDLIRKTLKMQEAGFRIGIYGVMHPDKSHRNKVEEARKKCLDLDIDFRDKEFLGEHESQLYGTYKYDGSVGSETARQCECRTTELVVGPSGHVYRCHADLYSGRSAIAHILDSDFTESELEAFRSCSYYGRCNPCDVKVKTNRFQIFGHTSVEIRNVK
jgi:organic radical activating enzyme